MLKLSLMKLLFLLAFISCSRGKVYDQCKSKSGEHGQTKIFTNPTNTPITQIKWLARWDKHPWQHLYRRDMVLAATYDRVYLFQMDEVQKRTAPTKLSHQEALRFARHPNATNSMLGFCPENVFGRIALHRRLTPPYRFTLEPEDAQLEVCGSNCGRPWCRYDL